MRFGDYPDNLLREICPEIEAHDKRPEDFTETLAYLLAGLPRRRRNILLARFKDGKTLDECGKMFGIQRERVRQIEGQALSALREPVPQRYLKCGVRGIIEQEITSAYNNGRESMADSLKSEIEQYNERIDRANILAAGINLDTIGLSVRAYNSLSRKGCKTVYDVLSMNPTEFWKTRNLGKKTGEEIIDALQKLRFDCSRITNARRY